MRSRFNTLFLPSLTAAVVLAAGTTKLAAAPPQRPPPAVTVSAPVQREIIDWDEFPARLDAVDMVEIRARVSGYLQSVNFKDGAEVKKGDLLFVIDPRPYQADLDRAEANVKQAQARLNLATSEKKRADNLLQSKAISESEADTRIQALAEAEAVLQSARSAVDMAKLNMEYTRITSPINGRIGRKLVTEGNLVMGNQSSSNMLAVIVSVDPIYAYLDADEKAVQKYQQMAREGKGGDLSGGQVACELELSNESDFPHKGVLDFVDNRVDSSTGTLRLRGVFANPAPERFLQPGFFARVRVPASGKYNAILVPDTAIGTDQGEKYVFTLTATNTVQRKTVQVGPLLEGMRVVRSGVKAEDSVVVNGLMTLMMMPPGAPVSPTRADASTPASAVPGAAAAK